jgi:hypothetical protein
VVRLQGNGLCETISYCITGRDDILAHCCRLHNCYWLHTGLDWTRNELVHKYVAGIWPVYGTSCCYCNCSVFSCKTADLQGTLSVAFVMKFWSPNCTSLKYVYHDTFQLTTNASGNQFNISNYVERSAVS